MLEIQKRALERVVAQLNAMNVQFAIVADGVTYGTLPVDTSPHKVVTRKPRRNMGRLGVADTVRGMKPGDVHVFGEDPQGEFTLQDILGNASSTGVAVFGKGNFTCMTNKTNNTVECMRVA